jgi:hypothetical protein
MHEHFSKTTGRWVAGSCAGLAESLPTLFVPYWSNEQPID